MTFSDADMKRIAYYKDRYNVIADHPLVAEHPIRMNDHKAGETRRCRFCGRSQPDITFRKTAHAIPEFLGNKSLISMNECDACNEMLADTYEDHLSKWFGPMRTVSQMHGKRGVPTYKDIDGRMRIEMGESGLHFTIIDAGLTDSLDRDGPLSLSLPVDTPSQPHVPLNAAMALVKIACSICPAVMLPSVQPAIDWLMGNAQARVQGFPVLYSFTPGPNPYQTGKVMLLGRKVDEAIPYLWCIIASTNYRFQFFVPFCPEDGWAENGKQASFNCMHFPVPFGPDWQYGKTEYRVFDWSGTEPIVKTPEVTMHVEKAERINTANDTEITDLYPSELSVVRHVVENYERKIAAGEQLDPVRHRARIT